MLDVQQKVVEFIRREQLCSTGDRIVIGVSGGPDSLCLLHVLWNCRRQLGIGLSVAHLNHMIRRAEAEADARFVAELAVQWGIPCVVEARNVPEISRQRKLALEEAARRARYEFLAEVAHRTESTHIAVGHNADDQSETVLMHWLRGAGLAGLRGMLPATPMSELRSLRMSMSGSPDQAPDLWLIRPLLETPRADVEEYCRDHGLTPRLDRSNLDTTYFRNKLRHELLPYLERAYKPGFRAVLRRNAKVIRADYDLLRLLRQDAWRETVRQASEEAVAFDLQAWRKLDLALKRATLRQAVRCLRRTLRDVSLEHVDAAVKVADEGGVGRQATLPRGLVLALGYETLFVANADYVPEPDFAALDADRVPLAVPGITRLPGNGWAQVQVVLKCQLPSDWSRNPDPWRAFLDAEAVGPAPSLRRRRQGDRFQPLGLGGRHKLVSELLVNEKVPTWWRDWVPLLVRGDDEIMWVCGWRIDERAKVTDSTSSALVIRLSVERPYAS